MATKPIKYLGNTGHPKEYWVQAAKQIEWPVDYEEQHVSVPESEIEAARQNLMVQHFCNNGFHIQSAISVEKSKLFVAPVTPGPIFRGELKDSQAEAESLYNLGDKFKVISDGCVLCISRLDHGKIHLDYLNRNKPSLLISETQLTKSLNWGNWEIVL